MAVGPSFPTTSLGRWRLGSSRGWPAGRGSPSREEGNVGMKACRTPIPDHSSCFFKCCYAEHPKNGCQKREMVSMQLDKIFFRAGVPQWGNGISTASHGSFWYNWHLLEATHWVTSRITWPATEKGPSSQRLCKAVVGFCFFFLTSFHFIECLFPENRVLFAESHVKDFLFSFSCVFKWAFHTTGLFHLHLWLSN